MRTRWVVVLLMAPVVVFALLVAGVLAASTGGLAPGSSGATTLRPNTVPAAYAGLIQKWGNLCPELSPGLLAAQLYQESGFDTTVASPAGAIGIAQFLPGTFASWAHPEDGTGPMDPTNPTYAIPAAARLDCANAADIEKEHLGTDVVGLMLAAYNAGLGAVQRYHGIPPYAETQNYVANIMKMAPNYTDVSFPGVIGSSQAAVSAAYYAYSKLGTPYLWGGTGTAAEGGRFDCSGLTQAAYASVGVKLPRLAYDQWWSGPHIPRDQLQIGDLVFFATNLSDWSSIHHVGIYIGGGLMIDAPHTGAVVRFDPIDQPDYFGASRPMAQLGQNSGTGGAA